MLLHRMLELTPPPSSPSGNDFEWMDIEAHLGVNIPSDFKVLVTEYGSGCFQPSGLSLCNYLDRQAGDLDSLLFWAKRDPGETITNKYPFYPKPFGLLPFASCTPDLIYLWNPARKPWTVVCSHQNGLSSEELHIQTIELLFKTFFLPAQAEPPLHMEEFLRECIGSPPQQIFQIRVHKPLIQPGLCEVIAKGGGRISYRARNIDLSLRDDLTLMAAKEECADGTVLEVTWRWRKPGLADAAASTCSALLKVMSAGAEVKDPGEQLAYLHDTYFANRLERAKGSFDIDKRRAYWVRAADSSEQDEPVYAYNLVFLGDLGPHYWELWVTVDKKFLERFFPEFVGVVQSMRISD